MGIRRICAVVALAAMTIMLTGGVAAARDYPPTTSTRTEAASTGGASTAPSVTGGAAAAPASGTTRGLPFTGGNDLVLFWVGASFVGAGGLALVRIRRRRAQA